MFTPTVKHGASETDKTVRRLDDFPQLLHALEDGDFETGRLVCAQVFGYYVLPNPVATTKTAAKAAANSR